MNLKNQNLKILFIIPIIIILVLKTSYSQNTISGIVYDSESKDALIGTNIYIPDLHRGSVTDNSGKFIIENIASGRFDMFVSYMGYRNQIVKIQTDTVTSEIIIFMEPESFQSQEIIVSGSKFSLQHENAIEVKCIKLSSLNHSSTNFIEQIAEVPGVDIISKGAGIAKPVIRGLSNTNILFIANGIRMENFQFSENHPFMVDEFGIERIEVIKGPASLLYGSDAVGGVIFAVRENPPHGNKFAGDYSLQYHDNSKGLHSSIGLQGSYNNFHVGIRASLKSHQDYTDGNNAQVSNTRFNQKSIKSVLGYSHKKGNFDIYYDYIEMQLGMCVPPSISLISENNRENKVWYQDLSNHVLSVKNKLFFGNLKLDINAAFQSNNRTLLTSDLMPEFKIVDMFLNTVSSEIKTTYSLKKGEIIFGLQNMYQTNKNADAPEHIIPDAQIFDMSVFTLFTSSFTDKLHFQSGLRYDYRDIHIEPETNEGIITNNYQNATVSAGFTYQFTKKLLLRTNFASAHRSPNIAELTQDGMHGSYYERGNISLKSQRNYEPDLSLHYHSKNFIYEISSFYNKITNYIFLQKTYDTTQTGTSIYQYSQTNANIYGFETGFKIMPVKFMQFHANYAFITAKQKNGDYLPFIPQNKIHSNLKFIIEKKLFLDNIYLSINATYAFRHTQPAQFETETPQYFITNIAFGFEKHFKKQIFTFSTGINNLFNEKYINHLSTLKGLNFYETGRNFYINFKIQF